MNRYGKDIFKYEMELTGVRKDTMQSNQNEL